MKISSGLPCATLEDGFILVSAFGRDWIIERRADIETLWAQMDEKGFEDERIPYWAELWPSSLALGQWLFMMQARIRGRLCLDLGCGLGFTAMLGEWLGARVIACDYEFEPLREGWASAAVNHTGQPIWVVQDWRQPAVARASVSHLWAGDILYEMRAMAPVLAFMDWCLEAGGSAWLAEPGRAIFRHFIELAVKEGWRMQPLLVRKVCAIHPQAERVGVTIWEASRE